MNVLRAVSSAVRASRLHREGPRFKSVTAHHSRPNNNELKWKIAENAEILPASFGVPRGKFLLKNSSIVQRQFSCESSCR